MSGREVLSVPVDRLCPDLSQPRKQFDDEALLGLAKTLKEGQLQPILAYRRGPELVILDGERRWRAARLAGLPSLSVLVVDAPTPEEALERGLVANLQREDLSPIDKARAIDRLMKATKSPASQVALRLGLSAATVSRLLALLELPESVQTQVDRRELPASTAYQIARAGAAGDVDPERLAAEVMEKGLTRDSFTGKRGVPRVASQVRVVASLGAGRTVTVSGEGLTSLDRLVEWLEELLAKARKARPRGVELSTFIALLRDEAKSSKRQRPARAKAAGGDA